MNRTFILEPIAFVRNNRKEPVDDNWKNVLSEIELIDEIPEECFAGIEEFSHLEIIYYFHKSDKTLLGSEHPRENPDLPKVGVFAQRKKDRPNHLGSTIVNLINREGRILIVSHLDAIDVTPVLDIKPIFRGFLPQGEIRQPEWVGKLMREYWEE